MVEWGGGGGLGAQRHIKKKFLCKLESILDNSIIFRPGLEWLVITIANAVSPLQRIRFSTPCQENGKGEIWASGKYLRQVKASEKATVNHQAEMKMVSSLFIIQQSAYHVFPLFCHVSPFSCIHYICIIFNLSDSNISSHIHP